MTKMPDMDELCVGKTLSGVRVFTYYSTKDIRCIAVQYDSLDNSYVVEITYIDKEILTLRKYTSPEVDEDTAWTEEEAIECMKIIFYGL